MSDALLIKFLALMGFVVVVNVILFWRQNVDMSESKADLEATIQMLERKKTNLLMKNTDLERQAHRMALKMEHLEIEVRDYSQARHDRKNLPMVFFVTPTKRRPEQKADLTRLGQTLAHIPNLFWILVEDAEGPSDMIRDLLDRLKMTQTSAHLAVSTPEKMRMNASDPNWKLPRGVEQRNAALEYLRTNHASWHRGAVYFGDDDNTYDWRLFDEIRKINRVGVWPVGIVGGLIVEAPIVASNGTVTGFTAKWKPERPFPIDMAAFAVNLSLIVENRDAGFSFDVPRGYQESHFLTSLKLSRNDLEPRADFCSKVYVWHTRTEKAQLSKKDLQRTLDPAQLSEPERNAIA
uniref:Galactosylgalactosylxylosylprotein 3-beta-glucuronosyltransferase n=1 Tax=Panagrellus redivivus TaxID=6233 RepID=A0A7E4V615_PANRE